MMTLEPQNTVRATAMDCRCPPESVSTRWSMERNLDAEVAQVFLGALAHGHPVEDIKHTRQTRSDDFTRKEKVSSDVEIRGKRQVLIRRFDSRCPCIPGTRESDRRSTHQQRTGIRRQRAGDDLRKRRFSGTVVSDERNDLAL